MESVHKTVTIKCYGRKLFIGVYLSSFIHLPTACNVQSFQILPFSMMKIQSPWTYLRKRHYSSHASKNVYVTTPIFYVNAEPHIGHLYTAVLADTISRYNSMLGHSVFLCTGADEHGSKVEKAAKMSNMPIPKYCTLISSKFRDMCNTFEVDYSAFIRTSDERHQEAVQHFWTILQEKGHIYMDKYSGWYCVQDEAFLSDLELIDHVDSNGNNIKVSAESGHRVEWTEEESYKFRLSAFQDDLRYWLKNENTVKPPLYHKMLSHWIEDDSYLQDLSISRPRVRVPWAIPTPCNESHSIYVWMDALVNYLTALGYPDSSFKRFWPPTIQVIGKDILKFHGIYWPAFLIAAGLEPPRTLLCHSHWTVDYRKMSKSLGNVISPFAALKDYTQDGLRYFLLRHAVLHSNTNFSAEMITKVVNCDLANRLGNLLNRCFGKACNPEREICDPKEYIHILTSDIATAHISSLNALHKVAQEYYEACNIHDCVSTVIETICSANRVIDYYKPWLQADNSNLQLEKKAAICLALETVRVASVILQPVIPRLASNVLDILQVPKEDRTWMNAVPLHLTKSSSSLRHVTAQNTVVFKRLKVSN